MKKVHIYLTRKAEQEGPTKDKQIYFPSTKTLKNMKISKQTEIHIYDKTTTENQKNKKIAVKDHTNKTGKNILIDKATAKPRFIDLTQTYTYKGRAVTTTCLGKRYNIKKHQHKHPSTFLCHYSTFFKSRGYTKIYGWLINE